MSRPERPDVVDLRRYREQRAEAARRKAAAPPRPGPARPVGGSGKEPVLGARRGAGVILLLVVLAVLALWLGPRFL